MNIAENPYDWEIVAEADIVRGGDGGSSICGGYGFFMGWLPLATAFIDLSFKEFKEEYEDKDWKGLSEFDVRRIYPLS